MKTPTRPDMGRTGRFVRLLARFVASVAVYLGVVVGGVTLFLVIAPVVGYLPYSDRPGPGWYGTFPALGWSEFWSNAGTMLEYGLFFATIMSQFAVVAVLVVRGMERVGRSPFVIRSVAAALVGAISLYGIAGVGWYVSLGAPAVLLGCALGIFTGGCLLPRGSAVRPVRFSACESSSSG